MNKWTELLADMVYRATVLGSVYLYARYVVSRSHANSDD